MTQYSHLFDPKPPLYCDSEFINTCLARGDYIQWNAPVIGISAFLPNPIHFLNSTHKNHNGFVSGHSIFLSTITTTFHLTWLYTIDCLLNGHRYGTLLSLLVNVLPSFVILISIIFEPGLFFIHYIRTLNQIMSIFLLWGIARTGLCVLANVYNWKTRPVKSGFSSNTVNFIFAAVMPAVSLLLQFYPPFVKQCLLGSVLVLKILYPFEEFPQAIMKALAQIRCAALIILRKSGSVLKNRVKALTYFQTRIGLKATNGNVQKSDLAKTIPVDILLHLSNSNFGLTASDMKELRLVNKQWSYAVSCEIFKKISIDLSTVTSDAVIRGFQTNGDLISSVYFSGFYDALEHDEAIAALLSHARNLKCLKLNPLQSQTILPHIARSCLQLRFLDISHGYSLTERMQWNPIVQQGIRLWKAHFLKQSSTKEPTSPSSPPTPNPLPSSPDANLKYSTSSNYSKAPYYNYEFHSFTNLTGVNLSGFLLTGRQLCKTLSIQRFQLSTLHLSYCPKITHASFILEFFPNMKSLDLSHSKVETLELAYMFQLIFSRRSNLERLILANVKPDISNAVLVFGSQMTPEMLLLATGMQEEAAGQVSTYRKSQMGHLSSLKYLDISHATLLRFEELILIVSAFGALECLLMRACRRINLYGYAWTIDALSNLHNLDLTDGNVALNAVEMAKLSVPVIPPPVAYSLHLKTKNHIALFRQELIHMIAALRLEQEQEQGLPDLDMHFRYIKLVLLMILMFTLGSLIYAVIVLIK